MARKATIEELEGNSKLWFKPYCRACGLLFESYKEYIEHCASAHWRPRRPEGQS